MASALQTKQNAVKAQILALLTATLAAGIPVYDWIRNVNHEATIAAILKDTGGKMHFWQFGLAVDTPQALTWFPSCDTRVHAMFDLMGYYAVEDLASPASEKTFEGEVADVICAFNGDTGRTLAGNVISAGPIQRPQGGHVMIASVLCHYARLRLDCNFQATGC